MKVLNKKSRNLQNLGALTQHLSPACYSVYIFLLLFYVSCLLVLFLSSTLVSRVFIKLFPSLSSWNSVWILFYTVKLKDIYFYVNWNYMHATSSPHSLFIVFCVFLFPCTFVKNAICLKTGYLFKCICHNNFYSCLKPLALVCDIISFRAINFDVINKIRPSAKDSCNKWSL